MGMALLTAGWEYSSIFMRGCKRSPFSDQDLMGHVPHERYQASLHTCNIWCTVAILLRCGQCRVGSTKGVIVYNMAFMSYSSLDLRPSTCLLVCRISVLLLWMYQPSFSASHDDSSYRVSEQGPIRHSRCLLRGSTSELPRWSDM